MEFPETKMESKKSSAAREKFTYSLGMTAEEKQSSNVCGSMLKYAKKKIKTRTKFKGKENKDKAFEGRQGHLPTSLLSEEFSQTTPFHLSKEEKRRLSDASEEIQFIFTTFAVDDNFSLPLPAGTSNADLKNILNTLYIAENGPHTLTIDGRVPQSDASEIFFDPKNTLDSEALQRMFEIAHMWNITRNSKLNALLGINPS